MYLKEDKIGKYEHFYFQVTYWPSSVYSMRQKKFWSFLLWMHSIFCLILECSQAYWVINILNEVIKGQG